MHRRPRKTGSLLSAKQLAACRLSGIGWLALTGLTWLFASLIAHPVHAAQTHAAGSKTRPGPVCQPIALLLAGVDDTSGDASSPDGTKSDSTSPDNTSPDNTSPDNTSPDSNSSQSPITVLHTAGNKASVNQDVCVKAHVYQVIELPDGIRFLDVCPSTIPDADCRFILLSLPADHEEAGDLRRLGGTDIQLRGTLHPMHGRFGMYITHARQLAGGPEKFRPNPRLLRDFDAESDRLAVRDPNLRGTGHRRSFMNRTLKEPANP